jgi:hypothetical protein
MTTPRKPRTPRVPKPMHIVSRTVTEGPDGPRTVYEFNDGLTMGVTVRDMGEPTPAYRALWRLLLSPLPDEEDTPSEPAGAGEGDGEP